MVHSIDFIAYPDALTLDITGPLEVFNSASQMVGWSQEKEAPYSIRIVGMEKGPVRLSSGMEILAQAADEGPACHTLVIPGGIGARAAIEDAAFLEMVRVKAARAQRIVSVCNGAYILAAAGILDNKQATTHWMVAEEMAGMFPKVRVVPDAIFTQDGNVYTSGGVTAGIDLALAMVEEDLGLSIAMEVSRLLLVYFRRPGAQSQFSTPLRAQAAATERFASLHNWLLNNISRPITVEHMADRSAMSLRNFSRVFKKTTGLTPKKYLEGLRLDRAREILASGDDTLENIAEHCGFGREERLRRAFLRKFKLTPSQYRYHFFMQERSMP